MSEESVKIPTTLVSQLSNSADTSNQLLANSLALKELGAVGMSDQELGEMYGLDQEGLKAFREKNRQKIESAKEFHKHGKLIALKGVARAMAMREAMIDARLEGKHEAADLLKSVLVEAEKVFGMGKFKAIAEMYNSMEDKKEENPHHLSLHTHYHDNPEVQKAKALLAERQAKIIDVSQ